MPIKTRIKMEMERVLLFSYKLIPSTRIGTLLIYHAIKIKIRLTLVHTFQKRFPPILRYHKHNLLKANIVTK